VLKFFLEWVRDLQGQELLRELIGIVAPIDLTGLVIVEIFHCSEGEDIEKVA